MKCFSYITFPRPAFQAFPDIVMSQFITPALLSANNKDERRAASTALTAVIMKLLES